MPELARRRLGASDVFADIRQDFPSFRHSSSPYHYLDSAASSHKPDVVANAVTAAYTHDYAPVHRGLYPQAEQASDAYEQARATIAAFISAPNPSNLVFTRSATESVNLVAQGWAKPRLQPGDEIWVSEMEHHANYLPWQRVCQERGGVLRIVPIDDNGRLDLNQAEGVFGDKCKLIALSMVSNVMGTINPVEDLIETARARGIPVLLDAAQAVSHLPVDVQSLGCDFLVASSHKMCGPGGIGLLYGSTEKLEETQPLLVGGGMVDDVRQFDAGWADVPARFEAGSPHLAGALGFAAAADYLRGIGLTHIEKRVRELVSLALEELKKVPGITFYGKPGGSDHAGIISFNLQGIHPHDVAQIAADEGVAIRAGHHCCQPLMRRLGVTSTARASFSFYNDEQDVAALIRAVGAAKETFDIS